MSFPTNLCGNYYGGILFSGSEDVSRERLDSLDALATKYHFRATGDPRLGLPENPTSHDCQIAYIFEGAARVSGFLNELLNQEEKVEVRFGLVKK